MKPFFKELGTESSLIKGQFSLRRVHRIVSFPFLRERELIVRLVPDLSAAPFKKRQVDELSVTRRLGGLVIPRITNIGVR